MRARAKRKRRIKLITYLVVVFGAGTLIFYGIYVLNQQNNAGNSLDGTAVSSADLAQLRQDSLPPYSGLGSGEQTAVKSLSGSPLLADGKPILVFVGEEGCPYCAETRWGLVMALMRFGNFTNLSYMSSYLDGTDFPTFTFYGSTYSSPYLVFQSFELYDRVGNPLQTLPSNYSQPFSQYGGDAFPFLDFGGKAYVEGAILPAIPSGYSDSLTYLEALFGSENWTQVFQGISSNNALGSIMKADTNVITAAICNMTGNSPASVCSQGPIVSLEGYAPSGLQVVRAPSLSQPQLAPPQRSRRG